jgi:pimeloyl-ACP methyl ester carboxylesterase
VPDVGEALAAFQRGEEIKPPYTLDDMADDAIRYPSRVRSLISMESSTGDPALPQPKPDARAALLARPPAEREAYVEHMVNAFQATAGSTSLFDRSIAREHATRYFDRCYYPQGVARQMVALLAAGNRKEAPKSVKAPTLVIHGSEDPLVPVEHGRAPSGAIPGAKLVIIEGMGHGLAYPKLWSRIVDAISDHTHEANASRRGQEKR